MSGIQWVEKKAGGEASEHASEPAWVGQLPEDDLVLLLYARGNLARLNDSNGQRYQSDEVTLANARRLAAAWNACLGVPTDELERMGKAGVRSLIEQGKQAEAAARPWHLFNIEASDDDGVYVYIVSAQSESQAKAQELAETSVLDDAGTADRPAEIGEVTYLGTSDSDIFEKVGPH